MIITLRGALKSDKLTIAKFMVDASGGLCDYMLGNNANMAPANLLSFEVAKNLSPFSFNNCYIAQCNQDTSGLICFYDAKLFVGQLDMISDMQKKNIMSMFYQVDMPSNTIYIDTVCIDTQFKGMGIGKSLFASLATLINANHYKYLSLYVWNSNNVAINLYEHFGFKIFRRIKVNDVAFPIHDTRLLMVANLNDFCQRCNNLIFKHEVQYANNL